MVWFNMKIGTEDSMHSTKGNYFVSARGLAAKYVRYVICESFFCLHVLMMPVHLRETEMPHV